MKFSSDKLMPFFEVSTVMSKLLGNIQIGKEIVITRHGKANVIKNAVNYLTARTKFNVNAIA